MKANLRTVSILSCMVRCTTVLLYGVYLYSTVQLGMLLRSLKGAKLPCILVQYRTVPCVGMYTCINGRNVPCTYVHT